MKTKIKRHSRSVIAVVLTLCMLVSCMTVGIIATDAAKTAGQRVGAMADGEALGDGDTTYYLHYGTDASNDPEHTTKVTMTSAGNNTYTASFTAGPSNYFFGINTSTTAGSDFTSSTSYTSTTTNWGNIQNDHNNYWATSWATNGSTVYVTFNSSTGAVTSSSTDSGGGGGESETKHAVTFNASPSEGGTITPATGTEVGESTATTITATPNDGYKFSSWTFGSGIEGESTSANQTTITTKSSGEYTVTANFTENTAASPFYYNSYGSDGQPAGTHYGAQMTEAKLNGETFSYYHVTGRTESDQLFTVSYGSPKYNSYNTYFEIWSDWENGGVSAQFYATDGNNLGDYTGMKFDTEANEKKKFKIAIPDGAREVQFKHGGATTGKLSLASGNNAWYTNNKQGSLTDLTGYNSSNPVPVNFYENFNGTNKYTNAFSTKGFNNHGTNRGEYHNYTKPKDLGEYSDDYYIVVLYQNKTYTINGVTKTISNDPEIIWLPELPGTNTNNAIVYAKDGTLRAEKQTFADHATTVITGGANSSTRKDNDYDYLKQEKDGTTLTITTTIDSGDWRNNYYVKGFNVNGVTPQLLTESNDGVYTLQITLDEDKITFDGGDVDYINGKYVEITPIYYMRSSYLTTNNVEVATFYVRGFDDTVKASWGDTIAAYPFYNGASGTECAFGGYPGQPMINYGGKLYIDVPLSVINSENATCTIQGITLSNNYWDRIHGTTKNEGNLQHIKAVTSHVQTYDFDDFSKIYEEVKESGKSPETIVFDFKYRTSYNNEKGSTLGSISTYTNGWDDLVNAQGVKTDLFGNELNATEAAQNPIYVVSDGYFNEYSGAYSTEWHVYQNNGTYIGSINPSVRWVQSADRLSESIYPYSGSYSSDQYYHIDSFSDEYTTLKTSYSNVPVKITFEREIRNESGQTGWDSYNHNSNDNQKAKRSDGLWMYSFKGTKINANTVIEYSDNNGATYTVDPYNTDSNESSKGMKAYFTNSDFYGKPSVETRSDKDKHFTFKAESAGEYIFVGWYNKEMDGATAKYLRISTAVEGESSMESGGTFVARFIRNPSGQLTISHNVLKDSTYDGDGTTTLSYEIKDAENTSISSASNKSEFTIPSTYIKYNHGYTVTVTLSTTPKGDDTFAQYATGTMDTTKFFDYSSSSTVSNVTTTTFSFDVDDLFEWNSTTEQYEQTTSVLRYYSQLNKIEYTYTITYNYRSYRGNKGNQYYKVDGTFTPDDIANYLNERNDIPDKDQPLQGGGYQTVTAYAMDDADKRQAFINKYGPYENDFLVSISWNTSISGANAMTAVYHGNTRHYDIDVNADTSSNAQVKLDMYLPYDHKTTKAEGYAATKTDGKYTYNENTLIIQEYNLDQGYWFATNGKKTYYDDSGSPEFVTAPDVIYNGDDPLVFRYWIVKTRDTHRDNQVEYTRCFHNEFNLSLYQDSYVTPCYTAPTEAEITAGKYTSPHDLAKTEGLGATITFMENSRNQYNRGGKGTETISTRSTRGDRVFTDFLISFANSSDTQYSTYANNTYKAGIVVERVAKLDKNQLGDFTTLTEAEYRTKYGEVMDPTKITDITAFIENTGTYASSGTAYRDGNEKYDTNSNGVIKYQKSEVDANTLDNKNRMDFYYSMSVRNHTTDFAYNHNADYVYRAYSYIKNVSTGEVELLSNKPLYFTIYDMASIANAADGYTYDNPPAPAAP